MPRGKTFRYLVPSNAHRHSGVLYLIGFKDGGIKIGRSKSPRERLQLHRQKFGDEIAWVHVFANASAGTAEGDLKKKLAGIGSRVGRTEMFYGIPKATCISVCRAEVQKWVEYCAKAAASQKLREREARAWKAFRAQWRDELACSTTERV